MSVSVCEGPHGINLVVRECTLKFYGDIWLSCNKLQNTSVHVWNVSSKQTPESSITKVLHVTSAAVHVLYMSIVKYIQVINRQDAFTWTHQPVCIFDSKLESCVLLDSVSWRHLLPVNWQWFLLKIQRALKNHIFEVTDITQSNRRIQIHIHIQAPRSDTQMYSLWCVQKDVHSFWTERC